MELRSRLHMENDIDDEDLADGIPPYFRPSPDSVELRYMMDRRRALDGAVPRRVVRDRRPIAPPSDGPFLDMRKGSGGRKVSTTMAFTALLRDLLRDLNFGPPRGAHRPPTRLAPSAWTRCSGSSASTRPTASSTSRWTTICC